MPLIVKDFGWEETDKMVWVTVPLKGVKANKVDISSTDEYLKVKLLCLNCIQVKVFACYYLSRLIISFFHSF